MNQVIKNIEETTQVIEVEEYQRGYASKATFNGELLRKIQGLKFNLRAEDSIFSRLQRTFSRNKISYHEYQEIEKAIEITQTTGKQKLNLLKAYDRTNFKKYSRKE